ncbi:3-oxoadipate enol-lactonase [Sulfitobacter mediterraneus]|uniref:3-oxoadipate enol-lactonase n=1 Tax=Sulfitobacter mediterraneus TaxID=83219 RepID=UPI00193AB511|nr:3-oxoadipate enol-lactonase [Sulfitobacter mediterraneus]MBM1556132.1 3-oxoadipate enol-lactonase [Sulfitobacter mediterraneus]MBM1567830.1 3-oxoadipate enol-lactonase [Sulfitobacter mediterraneus]MBM1571486.1 3-oxoadipate enol-lactonase [Sulfitobacter mediterraneus]MBM1575274.1 3-oxoadipate enol-lactonase [Sulfitobacter mediterraneus]MBM1579235.1 3-oxoadipate enol-lactonase [Sulfitobacter mediterraneus]
MKMFDTGDVRLHYRVDGPDDGAPVVFANSLGTDMRLWDPVLPMLPEGLRIIRFDKRGHGLSSCPAGNYSMGSLVTDTERLLDHLGVKECVFVGLSIGGMIAQGLAVKRLDLIRAVVLSNTAAKIGNAEMWAERIGAVRKGGIEALADAVMERWFATQFRATPELELWRNMLARQDDNGYIGCAAAISGTDFYTPTSGLRLPALGIAGSEDGSTPPDLVRETMDLIPGSKFHLIRKAGHLPCVEQPEEYAQVLTDFLKGVGHV